ncbi:hypothetical protein BASA81_000148 [Batrachochytrium salamandrivorans]|nr:hypothetical protein BASA81_000148 [Batrachochytrium salamandrivorans]
MRRVRSGVGFWAQILSIMLQAPRSSRAVVDSSSGEDARDALGLNRNHNQDAQTSVRSPPVFLLVSN